MIKRIGFIGLGMMGEGMAGNLLKNGFEILVMCHKNRKHIDELKNSGAVEVRDIEELATRADVIIMSLPGSNEVEEVILGRDGIIEVGRDGLIIIDTSTSYPPSTEKIAKRLGEEGIDMLDAPVTGGPQQAGEGVLNFMVGGEKDIYEKCLPLFQAMGKNVFYVGRHGMGHMVKLVNNFLGLLNLALIAEILPVAVKYGVDPKAVWDVVRVSGGNSKAFEGLAPRILKGTFDFSLELNKAYKDISYVSNLAKELKAPLLLGNAGLQAFEMARAMGMGNEDHTAVARVWEKLLGVEIRTNI